MKILTFSEFFFCDIMKNKLGRVLQCLINCCRKIEYSEINFVKVR